MSDVPEGPDWWLGEDRKWHPPPYPTPKPGRERYAASPYTDAPPGNVGAAPLLADGVLAAFVQLAGAALIIGGASPAWVTFDRFGIEPDRPGTEVDGTITLVLGIAIAVLAVLALAARRRWQAVGALVFATLVVIIAVLDISEINSYARPVTEHVGIGLWLTLVGGVFAGAGSTALVLAKRPKAARAA
jgi:hypothetical protein